MARCRPSFGIFFWLQGIEVASEHEAAVMPLLKSKLEEFGNKGLGYRWCGLRLANDKAMNKHFEQAAKVFDLEKSKYFIFHLDTA